VLALFTASAPPIIVMPELEMRKTEGLPLPLFRYLPIPTIRKPAAGSFASAFNQGSKPTQIGIEPLHLRYLELNYIKAPSRRQASFPPKTLFSGLRICKDQQEAMAMRKAVATARTP